ncbi:hypothetical protein PMAYCL1PPCAC_18514, partial [Pristionchus mayeri]
IKELEDIECFHGNILEDEIKSLLPRNGDFILRKIEGKGGGKEILVTVKWNEDILDLKLRAKKTLKGGVLYTLDGRQKHTSIKDLIKKHQISGGNVEYKGASAMLLNPIAKQAWELRPDQVHSGKMKMRMGRSMNVAVKVIKKCVANEKATTELQKEGTLMRKFNHPNVVRTFGMVIERDTIMVVMELISGGSLQSYVKKQKNVSMEEKGSYAYDIANGLAYIHSLNCIHRDIACRNCLIDVVKKQAKLSDFGLTRETPVHKILPSEKIPIRWIAPEVLKTFEYRNSADIYAFGILVWEIFSNGSTPFDTLTNAQIKEGIQLETFRPKFPDGTPQDVVDTINKCWQGDPNGRIPLSDV